MKLNDLANVLGLSWKSVDCVLIEDTESEEYHIALIAVTSRVGDRNSYWAVVKEITQNARRSVRTYTSYNGALRAFNLFVEGE